MPSLRFNDCDSPAIVLYLGEEKKTTTCNDNVYTSSTETEPGCSLWYRRRMSASAYECQCARVNIGEESLPEEFLQTGVTESVTTGGHLNRFPHRFAAQRTLEAPLRLLQKLVIEPRHGGGDLSDDGAAATAEGKSTGPVNEAPNADRGLAAELRNSAGALLQ